MLVYCSNPDCQVQFASDLGKCPVCRLPPLDAESSIKAPVPTSGVPRVVAWIFMAFGVWFTVSGFLWFLVRDPIQALLTGGMGVVLLMVGLALRIGFR